MADDLTGGTWVIDSTGVKTTGMVYIERIAWKNATTAGHTAKIVNAAGKMIWEHFAPGSTMNVSEPIGKVFQGLDVATLSSGKLYITFR